MRSISPLSVSDELQRMEGENGPSRPAFAGDYIIAIVCLSCGTIITNSVVQMCLLLPQEC